MAARQAGGGTLPTVIASLDQLVARAGHRMTRHVERALGTDGPTLEQWRVLDLLADGEGHPMSEIAAHAMVPAPTLTKIVDRLVDAALVYRRPDEIDRRRVLVLLSEHGREVHAALAPQVAAAEREIVESLDRRDVAELVRLLQHLAS